jgi:hypothetical protein
MPTNDAADEFDVTAKSAPEKAKEGGSENSSAAQTKPLRAPLPKPGPPPPKVQKPQTETEKAKAAEREIVDPVPKTFEEAQKLLEKIAALPERTAAEEASKKKRLARVQSHWSRLQQGLPLLNIDANSVAGVAKKQTALLHQERVKLKMRTDPIVRDLVARIDELTEINEVLSSTVAALEEKLTAPAK